MAGLWEAPSWREWVFIKWAGWEFQMVFWATIQCEAFVVLGAAMGAGGRQGCTLQPWEEALVCAGPRALFYQADVGK